MAFLCLGASPATAASKPQLKPFSVPSQAVAPGAGFKVSFVVTGRGRALSRAKLVWHLSPSKRMTAGSIRVGGSSLSKLRRKRSLKGTARLRVPSFAKLGSYHLLGCVQAPKARGRRRAPKPVCRASQKRMRLAEATLTAPPGGAPPAAPGSGTGGGPEGPGPDLGGPGPDLGSGGEPAVDPATPLGTPNPLNVTPVPDSGRAVTKTVGSAGATLTATDARGTTFTLTIPADALPGDTDIAMTPLSSIGGLPFSGGLVGAVDLKPDGLRLYKPATLSIQPTTMPAVGDQAPFLYRGSGQDFHSYPLVADATKLEMALLHFTGAGVATGSGGERAAQQERVPTDIESQFEQRGAEIGDRLRRGQITSEQFADEFTVHMRDYWNRVVRPRLTAAETNDTLAELAISTFLSWSRQLALLGLDDRFADEQAAGFVSMEKILQNAYNKSFVRCVGGEVAFVRRLVALARAGQLLGLDVGADALEKSDKCLRFELDYEYDLKYRKTGGNQERFDLEVEALRAPLRFDPASLVARGAVPLTAPVWKHFDNISNGEGGTATVTNNGNATLGIDANLKNERLPDGRVVTSMEPPRIKMALDPGYVSLTGFNNTFDKRYYLRYLRLMYPDLHPTPDPVLLLQNWTYKNANPWAEIVDIRHRTNLTALNDVVDGNLTLRLHHTPAPG